MPTLRPPRLTTWLFELLLSPRHDAVLGDLEEAFFDHAEAYGPRWAAWWYRAELLTSFPTFLAGAVFWRTLMLANYLKIALRNFAKYRGFTAINVLGLSVSLSLCLLFILFVQDQRRYDRFHEGADRIYRVTTTFEHGSRTATSPHNLGAFLRAGYAGVDEVVRMKRFGGVMGRGETSIPLRGLYAEPSYLDVFTFPLAAGNARTALAEPNTIVLSRTAATKLFGEADPMGQVVTLRGHGDLTVTGVLQPVPEQTILKYDALVSFATLAVDAAAPNWGETTWEYYNYVRLAEHALPGALEAQLPALVAEHYAGHPDLKIARFQLQPLTGVRLGPMIGNQHSATLPPVMVYALAVVALVVMLTACFNYMSLSVARSMKRAKEVGVRKVVGAGRGQIAWQFVGEALLTVLAAFVVAFGLLFWLVPAFNRMWAIQFTGSVITLDFTRDLSVFAAFLGFSVLVGLAAGIYPAFYLSSFRPVAVLKGLPTFRGASRLALRRVLVVVQFAFSLLFIVTTLLLYRQSNVMLAADYGFDREQVVNVELQGVPYERVRQVLDGIPQVAGVSATSFLAGSSDEHTEAIWTTDPSETSPRVRLYAADYAFVDNLKMTMVAGRTFSPAFATDSAQAVVLNETAVRVLGLGTPQEALGRVVHTGFPHRPEDASTYHVVGVVQDYHYTRLEAPIGPMLLYYRPDRFDFVNVRLHPGDPKAALAAVEQAWKPFAVPFRYRFYDDMLSEEYAIYDDAVGILGLASFFAILIACLGLFGMATYMVQARTKEVGVRKVMGAGVPGLVVLLSKDFFVLVLVAVVVAGPAAWFVNNLWLQHFAVRAPFDAWIFGPSILALFLLAALTVGTQTVRAALANPTDTLRYE